jgi:sugar lactone lactonase YvrE
MHRSRIGARVAPALLLVVGVIVGPSASTSLALDPLGTISTVAGGGNSLGDGGPATSAGLGYLPRGVAVDAAGNVYIADTGNNRVRKVGTDGTITTIAGTGVSGFSGDGGPATSAQLWDPRGVAVDAAGNVYIADYSNWRVRKVSTGGTITTIAGTGYAGDIGDGIPATSTRLIYPSGVAVDAAGNVYIADTNTHRVRKIGTDGTISTIAGTTVGGFSGDGCPATSAQLAYPSGVAVDAAGNIYIADHLNQRVRKIGTGGTITTIAGTGVNGFSGDGGPATSAELYDPRGVAVDAAGNVYIADSGNSRGRKIGTDGTITTIAGDGGQQGFGGDGGPATSAQLNGPQGVAVDPAGNLYIADTFNSRIRKVLLAAPPSGLVPLASRLFDTRPGTAAGAIAVPKQLVAGGSFLEVQLTGNAGIPGSGVGSVVLNVTAVDPTADGFVTVYPCGTRPATSNLNYTSGRTVANTVITPVSGAGKVCFYAHGTTHLIADLSGWFPT